MGLWKNAGVAICLQADYGFRKDKAELHANVVGELGSLPRTQFSVKRLKKQEIAAWLAAAQCMPPEGTMVDDQGYLRHVELTVDQEHRKGKIRVPMYRELLECFEVIRNPEMRQAVIDQYEAEKAENYTTSPIFKTEQATPVSKAEEAATILEEIYCLDRSITKQHIELTMRTANHGSMTAPELAAFSMIMSAREQPLQGPESLMLATSLRKEIDSGKFSPKFQKLVDSVMPQLDEHIDEFTAEIMGKGN